MKLHLNCVLISAATIAFLGCQKGGADDTRIAEKSTEKVVKPVPIDVWATEKSFSGRIALLLPRGKVRAEVLQIAAPARLVELTGKLKKAAQENPGTFIGQILQRKPGEPLPYDPKFGITEKEYKEYLDLSGQMILQKVGDADLTITVGPNDVYTIAGLPNVPAMQIDASKMVVKVAEGGVSQPDEVMPTKEQTLTGPLYCYSWRSGLLDALAGSQIKIMLGQVVESKQVVMQVRIKSLEENRYKADYLVRFSGPCK